MVSAFAPPHFWKLHETTIYHDLFRALVKPSRLAALCQGLSYCRGLAAELEEVDEGSGAIRTSRRRARLGSAARPLCVLDEPAKCSGSFIKKCLKEPPTPNAACPRGYACRE